MSRPESDPPQSQPPDPPKDVLSPVRVTPLSLSQTISSPIPQATLKRSSSSFGAQALVEQASWVEITALGLIVSTTGGSAWWNAAMAGGVVPGMVSIFIGGLGFILLQLCSAELTSTVPFSGGSYGFTRLAFGRQFGVLVGLTETLGYTFSLVAFAALVGDSWTTGWGNPTGSLLGALGSIVISTGSQLAGPRVFWRAVLGFGILIMVIQMAYLIICFSTGQMSLPKWAGLPHEGKENIYSLGFQGLLLSFPYGVNFYIGLESLALSAEDTKDPRTALPKGMIASAVLTMVFGIITPLVVVSSPSGLADLVDVDLPLAGVMSYTFGEAGPLVTAWLAIGSLFAGVLSNSHAVNRITFALARAGILPAMLAHTAAGVPRRVILLNTIVQVALILCIYFVGEAVWDIINLASIMCGLFHYISIFASYTYMKRKYEALPRDFVNPFGNWGAVFGIIIFAFSSGAMFAGTEGVLWAFVSWFLLLALFSAYYMFYARFHVRMSPEEVLAVGTQVTATKMLMTGLGYSFLHEHCALEFSTENIVCWKKIDTYTMNKPTFHGFEAIYKEHLCPEAAGLVNVPSKHFKESQRLYEALCTVIPEEQRTTVRTGRRSSKDAGAEAIAALSQSLRPALMSQTSRPPLIGQNTAKQLEAAGAAVAAMTDRARAAISGSQLSETTRGRLSQTLTGVDHEGEIRDLLEEVVKLLKLVQMELIMLLEKDTLPRFKATKHFAKYLEEEPLMFKENGPAMTPRTPHSKPAHNHGRVTPSPSPLPSPA